MLRKWPPGHILGYFLYQTDLFFHNKEFGNLQIVREGRNLKILGKQKIRNFKIWEPKTETREPFLGNWGRPDRPLKNSTLGITATKLADSLVCAPCWHRFDP